VASARPLRSTFALLLCGAFFVLPATAMAGTISGTVTATAGGAPIEGVEVCSHVQPYTFEDSCTQTDSGGHYTLGSFASGSFAIQFSDRVRNRNYVDQYFGGSGAFPGTLVSVSGSGENRTRIDAQLHAGSSISGTVTDAGTHLPVAGLPVCAEGEISSGAYASRCDLTSGGGEYRINGLPPAKYEVGFQSGQFNYQPQYYDGVPRGSESTLVEILAAEEEKVSIDAEMQIGAEITGTLSEVGTHQPVPHMLVELLQPVKEGNWQTTTDAAGHYAFRGLPEGEYIVAFSPANGPFGSDDDGFSSQYYKGSATLAGATVLKVVPGNILTGIDGEVVNRFPHTANPIQVTLTPTPIQKTSPLRCRRGFHKKKVRGRTRCVKVHKKRHHHHHPRHHGVS
jgi:hypothetical protein